MHHPYFKHVPTSRVEKQCRTKCTKTQTIHRHDIFVAVADGKSFAKPIILFIEENKAQEMKQTSTPRL